MFFNFSYRVLFHIECRWVTLIWKEKVLTQLVAEDNHILVGDRSAEDILEEGILADLEGSRPAVDQDIRKQLD